MSGIQFVAPIGNPDCADLNALIAMMVPLEEGLNNNMFCYEISKMIMMELSTEGQLPPPPPPQVILLSINKTHSTHR